MKIRTFNQLQQAKMTFHIGRRPLDIFIYMFDGVLIDTGPFRYKNKLIQLFDDWVFDQTLITHHHEDHTGMAFWIEKYKQTPIYMHEKGVQICAKDGEYPLYRRLVLGKRNKFTAQKISRFVDSNQYKWEVIDTPGHADDHISFYVKDKGWMFGGDLLVNITPRSMYRFESVGKFIDSLEKIASYDFKTYFCAHYGIMPNGKHYVEKKLAYMKEMRDEIIFLYDLGYSIEEIRERLFPKRHFMHYISFHENSPIHFIRSAISSREEMNIHI